MSEFHVHTRRRARKPHTCVECDREIPPGAIYWEYRAVYEGRWSTHKTCLDCEELIREHWSWSDEVIPFGELYDYLDMEIPTDFITRGR
jgi:hypothetical protein